MNNLSRKALYKLYLISTLPLTLLLRQLNLISDSISVSVFPKVRTAAKIGIPSDIRGIVWFHLSGGLLVSQADPDCYRKLSAHISLPFLLSFGGPKKNI